MDDLIYRAEAIEKAKHDYDYFKGALNATDKVRRDELLNVIFWLGNLPSVDAVPVVRCRDCKHHHFDKDGIPYCDGIDYGYGWKDDEFCSRGERK